MEISYCNDIVTIGDVADFNLKQVFDCGQAFHFRETSTGSYIVTAFSRVIEIRQLGSKIEILNVRDKNDFEHIWRDFFDLSRDYSIIKDHFSADPVMRLAMDFGYGIRLLRQDIWETLITFIMSQQNNIPRIKKNIADICKNFGDPIEYNGDTYYTFPAPEKLAGLSVCELDPIRCGFRASYILEAAKKVASKEIDLSRLFDIPTLDARKELMTLKGVGEKVANCVLLFGFGRFDAFPIDVWMKRAIETLYDTSTFDPSMFGEYSGIAQQYLFYYARENKIGKIIRK